MTTSIPNWLILLLTALFYVCAFAFGMPVEVIIQHTIVGVLALVAAIIASAFGIPPGVGKLLAVAFLWFGTWGGSEFLLYSWVPLMVVAIGFRIAGKSDDAGIPFMPFAVFALVMVAPQHVTWIMAA